MELVLTRLGHVGNSHSTIIDSWLGEMGPTITAMYNPISEMLKREKTWSLDWLHAAVVRPVAFYFWVSTQGIRIVLIQCFWGFLFFPPFSVSPHHQNTNRKEFLKKDYLFIYERERDRQREWERERGRDTGRGRSRLHAPGARRGIRSWVSRIVPWAKGRRQTTAPPRDPRKIFELID